MAFNKTMNIENNSLEVSRVTTRIRQLFAIMLTACEIDQLHLLWDELKSNIPEDFLNRAKL